MVGMRAAWVVAAIVAAVWSGAPARGQGDDGGAGRPDPAALMREMHAAVTSRESWSAEVRAYGVGARGPRTPSVVAGVKARAGGKKADFRWLFLVEGTARWTELSRRAAVGKSGDPESLPLGSSAFRTAFDGATVRTLREAGKVAIEGAWLARDEPLREGAGVALAWLLRWDELVGRPFGGEEALLQVRYEGTAEVGGVACDVVYADLSELNDPTLFDSWWMIGRADRLPRRIELNVRENAGDGFLVFEITPRESGVIEADALALATPEGWAVREAKAPEAVGGRGGGDGAGAVAGDRAPGLIAVGEPAPDFSLEDRAGKVHTLSQMRGKVVLLDFWATWCGPCKAAMPGMQRLHEAYKDKGLVVIGMNAWESGDPVEFMSGQGLDYLLLLKADEAAAAYRVTGIPTFYLIDAEGKVVHREVGFNPAGEGELGKMIEALLPK